MGFLMKCLTPKQAAEEIGCSDEQVRRWIDAGELLAFNIGKGTQRRRWKIPVESLQEFISGRIRSDSPPATKTTTASSRRTSRMASLRSDRSDYFK